MSNTGRTHFKKGMIPWNKGLKGWNKGHPATNKKPNSGSFKKGQHNSIATEFKKGDNKRLGKHHTETTKEKLRKFHQGKHHSPKTEFKKGHVVSEKRRQLARESTGSKSPNWKGGISKNQKHSRLMRKLRKQKAEGSHTQGEWELLKRQYGYKCPCCGKKEPKIKLTEDHIIPLSKGGSDYIENIQPLCKRCNSVKHTKIIKYKNGFNL